MRLGSKSLCSVAAAAALLAVTAVHVRAGELGFLEMLFGVRPPPQVPQDQRVSSQRQRLGAARHRLRTRYAALPVRIRANHLQTPLDMKQGAAAALMRDETLRPGDIVVLATGARVFTGAPDAHHTMGDFEPAQRSAYLDKTTRKLLAGMMNPVGALPADEARRVVARLNRSPATAAPASARTTAMRVINPWQTNP